MTQMRVLIVEDDPVIAMDLETTVAEVVHAVVIVKGSVEGTQKVLHEPLDFAFLDVGVTNGKTFEVAHILCEKRVPFVFVSASSKHPRPSFAMFPSSRSRFNENRSSRLSGQRRGPSYDKRVEFTPTFSR